MKSYLFLTSVSIIGALAAPTPDPQNISQNSCGGGGVYETFDTVTKSEPYLGDKSFTAELDSGAAGGSINKAEAKTTGWAFGGSASANPVSSASGLLGGAQLGAGVSFAFTYTDTSTSTTSYTANCSPNTTCKLVWQPQMMRNEVHREYLNNCLPPEDLVLNTPTKTDDGTADGKFYICYEGGDSQPQCDV